MQARDPPLARVRWHEGQVHRHCRPRRRRIRPLRRAWVGCTTESTMTTSTRIFGAPHRRTSHSVRSGVAVVQDMRTQVVQVGERDMTTVVPGVGTRVRRELGGRVSNRLISTTHVGRMILVGDTSLPRHLLERHVMLIPTPRARLRLRCVATLPVRRSVRHTWARRRIKMVNNTIMVGILIHNRPRQVMPTRRPQAHTPTPRRLIIHSKDSAPLRIVLNTLDRRIPDHMHVTMSVRTRTPT